MTRRMLGTALAILALTCVNSVHGSVIVFSQQPVDGAEDFISDFAGDSQEADDFLLGSQSTITEVHWWGTYQNNNVQPDNFTIRFFEDAGGVPEINPFVDVAPVNLTRTATSLMNQASEDIFTWSADLPAGVLLDANTTYYLSIVNDTGANGDFWTWAGDGGGDSFFRFTDVESWFGPEPPINHAFELGAASADVIPEPSAIAIWGLIGLTVGGFAWLRRRKS